MEDHEMKRQTLQEIETQLQNGEPVYALVETPQGWPFARVHEVRAVGHFETPASPAYTDIEVRVEGFVGWITYKTSVTSEDF
jgi:hypothetical protein